MRNLGNMLPPSADMVRMMSVEKAPSWARVRARLASSMPNDGHGKGRAHRHDEEAGNVGEEVEMEDERGPEEHERELGDGEQRAVDELAGEERCHGDARGEDAVEGAGFGLVEQAARRRALAVKSRNMTPTPAA